MLRGATWGAKVRENKQFFDHLAEFCHLPFRFLTLAQDVFFGESVDGRREVICAGEGWFRGLRGWHGGRLVSWVARLARGKVGFVGCAVGAGEGWFLLRHRRKGDFDRARFMSLVLRSGSQFARVIPSPGEN